MKMLLNYLALVLLIIIVSCATTFATRFLIMIMSDENYGLFSLENYLLSFIVPFLFFLLDSKTTIKRILLTSVLYPLFYTLITYWI